MIATVPGTTSARYGPSPIVQPATSLADVLSSIKACRTHTYALWDHSIRVAATAGRLATAIGLEHPIRRAAYLSGLLHDSGKTRLRHSTLFKAGPLSDEELFHVQQHAEIGAELVAGLVPESIVAAIRFHHELFDGTGYPAGLRAEEIPLLARIVTVADYYQAIREDRPYRRGRSREQTLRVVADATRTGKLDPRIARFLAAAARTAGERPFS